MKLYKGMKLRVLKDDPIGIGVLKKGDIITVTSVEGGSWGFNDDTQPWGWCENEDFEEILKPRNFNDLYTKLNSI